MALVNQVKREINAKIVYFGPELAGKATNLKQVFGKLKPEFRGTMKSMNVQDARMMFFDFTPPGDASQDGFRVRIHVYTISGAVPDPAAWKMVLKGVDGVVFVADAAPDRQDANRQSLASLAAYLEAYGQKLSSIPMVFQFNKRDLPDAQSAGEMQRALNPSGLPSFQASSRSGDGVLNTLLSLVKTVLAGLRGSALEGAAAPDGLQRILETPVAASAQRPAGRSLEELEAEELEVLELEAFGSQSAQNVAPLGVRGSEEPLSLELSRAPQAAGPGLFRLPLTIRAGARTKSVLLTLAISLEEQ